MAGQSQGNSAPIKPSKFRYPGSKRAAIAFAAVGMFLGGCAVGPDYVRPDIDMPGAYRNRPAVSGATTADANGETLAQWWACLNDPVLVWLIDRAVAGNLDLKRAESRLKEARFRRQISGAALFPSLSASGSASERYSGLTQNAQDAYGVGLDSAWELDIFGKNRRNLEASRAEYEASQEDLRSVLVSLTAEVAINYVQLRTNQKRIVWAQNNLGVQQETRDLARLKFETGLGQGLDVDRATYNLASTRAQLPELLAAQDAVRNRLAILLGEWPGDVSDRLQDPAPIPAGRLEIGIGIPADLLRRRPDVRYAEQILAARTAQIGAAEADLFPSFNLKGTLGYESLVLNGLISPANFAANVLSGVSWKLFQGGAIRNTIKVRNELQKQALLDYEATVHGAVEEVEKVLISLEKAHEKIGYLEVAARSAADAADAALQQYEAGLSDFENVLETQRSLFNFQDQLAQSRGAATLNLISLYKALGGGWSPGGFGG